MPSSEQQDVAATATDPAADAAPRATRPRSSVHAQRLSPAPTQRELVDAALRQVDATRTAIEEALGCDVHSLAAPNLHGAHGLLDEARRCLANARGISR